MKNTNYGKFLFIIILLLLNINCSNILLVPRYIDIENSNQIQKNMVMEEVIEILGLPNYTKIESDEFEDELIIHIYYVRDKIYRYKKILGSPKEFPSSKIEDKYSGYGEQKKLTIYYKNSKLFKYNVN